MKRLIAVTVMSAAIGAGAANMIDSTPGSGQNVSHCSSPEDENEPSSPLVILDSIGCRVKDLRDRAFNKPVSNLVGSILGATAGAAFWACAGAADRRRRKGKWSPPF